ncbi:VCBS domain-containing protein [Leisingera sp. ANG-Vp]|uniref:VCBS domain-containing protein n=1 Tax=Leisingera sp. ANG-Vp TaxID=1577896 RepID=UPI00187CAD2B|nr:VCBS domain-containing protein [Leisingera sp. ANG-Vp]
MNNSRHQDQEIDLSGSSHGAFVRTHRGDDDITGSGFGDWIMSGSGDDTVTGGGGNDVMFGGRGRDTAVFSGSVLDYKIVTFPGGRWMFVSGDDGCDFLHRFEVLVFDDFTLDLNSNNGPLAVLRREYLETAENDSFAFNVDVYDLDGDPVSLDSATVTGGGSLAVVQGGASEDAVTGSSSGLQISFDPGSSYDYLAAGETTTETVTLVLSDGEGGTTEVSYEITIQGENDGPVASAVSATADEDGPAVTVDAVFFDADASDTHTFSVDTTGTQGTVTNNGDGTFSYDPAGAFEHLAAGETATDTFAFTVDDGNGGFDTETVTVTVSGQNDAPVALAVSGDANEDGPAVTISADFSDADASDTHTFSIDTAGTQGTVTNNGDGTFGYDADGAFEHLAAGETATDTFTYTVDDGNGGTGTETVTVTVTGQNDEPDLGDPVITGQAAAFNGSDTYLSIASDPGLRADDWTIEAWVRTTDDDAAYNRVISAPVGGGQTYSLVVHNGQAHVRLDNGAGRQVEAVDVADGGWHHMAGTFDSTTNTLSLYVDGVFAGSLDVGSASPLTGSQEIAIGRFSSSFSGNYFDGDIADVRIWSVTRDASEIASSYDQPLDGSEAGLELYLPLNGSYEDQSPNGRTVNNFGTSLVESDAPVEAAQVSEDSGSATFQFDASDADTNDTLTYSANTAGLAGQVVNNGDGSFAYSANGAFDHLAPGETATESFDVTVDDGNGGSDTKTVTVTVTGANDAPDAEAVSASVQEDPQTVLSDNIGSTTMGNIGRWYVFDFDTGTAITLPRDGGANNTFDQIAAQHLSSGNGLIVHPNPNNSGWSLGSQVFVDGVGQPVSSTEYDITDTSGGSTSLANPVWLAFGDTNQDVDSISLTLTGIDLGDGRSVDVSVDMGPFDYEINTTDDLGVDAMTFEATVNGPSPDITVSADFTDPDSDTFTFGLDDSATSGSVVNNGDGTFTFSANGAFEHLNAGESATDTFTYTVDDGNGGIDSQVVTVTILGLDDVSIA